MFVRLLVCKHPDTLLTNSSLIHMMYLLFEGKNTKNSFIYRENSRQEFWGGLSEERRRRGVKCRV